VLGKSYGSLVCFGHERSKEFTGSVNGERRRLARLLERARERGRGFIGPVARRGGFASPSCPTGTPAWARGGGDVRQSRRPMGSGSSPASKCAQAAWHRPKLPRKHHGL
jgi:hypothetical protein